MNDFEGSDYVRELDQKRLTGQIARVFGFMSRHGWWTLAEIEKATGDPQASISAQLRHLRKYKWGSHEVSKRRRGGGWGKLNFLIYRPWNHHVH